MKLIREHTLGGPIVHRPKVHFLAACAAAAAVGIYACAGATEPAIVNVSRVEVNPTAVVLVVGNDEQITARCLDAAGTVLAGRTVTWSSREQAVATVTASGVVRGVAIGTTVVSAMCEQVLAQVAVTVTPEPVATVTVEPGTGSLRIGETLLLTATVRDARNNPLTGRTIVWTSSNQAVATVSSSGLVSAVGLGATTAIATSEGKSGTAAVTVALVPVASVVVSPATAGLLVGQTVQLAAATKDSAGGTLSGRTVTWTSSDTTKARVSSAGVVTGVAAGTATITATSEGKSGTAAVTVVPVPVASVVVSPATASLLVGQTVQLAAATKDSAGGTLTGRTVTWTSSDTTKARVSSAGVVTGVAAGTVTITATSEGKSGTAAVTVALVPVASVVVSPATAGLLVGQTVQLAAATKDSAGGTLTGRTVTWTSSDTTTARVSSAGVVTGVAAGTATITATSEGKSGTAAVTVAPVPVASVVVSPAISEVVVAQTVQLAATTKDSAGGTLTGRTVTWTSSDTTKARVSSAGVVTGWAAGTATITATSEGKSGSAAVTVVSGAGVVATVAITPWGGALMIGDTASFFATAQDAGGNVVSGTTVSSWTKEGSPSSVSLTTTGPRSVLLTAVAAGMVSLRATINGVNGGGGGATVYAVVDSVRFGTTMDSTVTVGSSACSALFTFGPGSNTNALRYEAQVSDPAVARVSLAPSGSERDWCWTGLQSGTVTMIGRFGGKEVRDRKSVV
jgi:uncharacterized protein YjdB